MIIAFAIIFFAVSTLVSRKYADDGVDDFVAAGRSVPFGLITASVMVSWVWTITIIGSAEAGFNYGVSGGVNYAWGAAVPFFIFIPLVMTLRKKCQNAQRLLNLLRSAMAKVFLNCL